MLRGCRNELPMGEGNGAAGFICEKNDQITIIVGNKHHY